MRDMSPEVAGHFATILDVNTDAIKRLLADREALVRYVRALYPLLPDHIVFIAELGAEPPEWKLAWQALSQELKDMINE